MSQHGSSPHQLKYSDSLSAVNGAIPRPPTKCFPIEVQGNSKQDKEQAQGSIGHNWRDVTNFNNPNAQELCYTIAPQVFIDCCRDEELPCNWLIRVNLSSQMISKEKNRKSGLNSMP